MDPLIAVVAGVFGALVGSFLNVVIHRAPTGGSLVRPPSQCPACGARIRPYDNIPVVSYVLLRARCRDCGQRIPARYPLVEILTAALFSGAFLRFADAEQAVFVSLASAVLVVLVFIDLDHRRVPNKIVIPAAAVAMVWVLVVGIVEGDFVPAIEAAASGLAGYVFLAVIAIASRGMGFGDVKLARFIGVVCGRFGWEVFVLAVFGGFVSGGVVAMLLLATGRRGRKDAIPFAPALCVGGIVGLFAGPGPVRAWMGL